MLPLVMMLAANVTELCPAYTPFFGSMGVTSAMIFTVFGSAYGTAKASVGISSMGVMKPELVMKGTIPVIFAGIIPIYGLIICIMIVGHRAFFYFILFLNLKKNILFKPPPSPQ